MEWSREKEDGNTLWIGIGTKPLRMQVRSPSCSRSALPAQVSGYLLKFSDKYLDQKIILAELRSFPPEVLPETLVSF